MAKTALVVEPDPLDRPRVEGILRDRGYEVWGAADVGAAVDAFRAGAPELLVCHLAPGEAALLCSRVRHAPGGHRVAILALVDVLAGADPREVLDEGADDYVAWPAADTEVAARIALSERRMASRAIDQGRVSRLENELREERDLNASVLDAATTLVAVFDRHGRIVRFNRACEEATGFRFDEVRWARAAELLVPPEDRAAPGPHFGTLLEMDRSGECEASWVHKDGGRRRIAWSVTVLRDEEGSVRCRVAVGVDVTSARQAERALRRSQSDFREVIERFPGGVAIHRGGRLLYVNPALAGWLGADPADLVGRAGLDLLHPSQRDLSDRRVRMPGNGLSSLPAGEYRCLRADGSALFLAVEPPIPIEIEGGPAQLVACRDITEQKQIQARLFLSDRLASVGTLAAGIAHEINNPLAYVIAHLGDIATELDALPETVPPATVAAVKELLQGARHGADRVRLIVRDLRTFSRFDEERIALIDVRSVLESSLSVAANEIRHRARLEREYGEVPMVQANEARLGQVFLNVLVNAAQAMPEGGADRHVIRVRTASEDGRVIVEVRDTGTGIAPEDLERIFDPFFTTKPVGVGTGLGLSICHSILSSLGGEIAVDSALGKGTVVRIALPAALDRPAEAAGSPAVPGRGAPIRVRARVLVVDDEPLIVSSLKRALRGHDVTTAGSGREAIDVLCREQAYDVVLCDLMMPDLTGMDVYEEVRRLRPGVADKMVFMTGGAFTPRARDFLARVPNEHLVKPFDLAAVRSLVRDRAAR